MKNFFKSSYIALIMLFIYIPIIILIIFSLNSGESMNIFNGFSNRWYKQLINEHTFIQSIIISLFTALIATIFSVIIGTLAAIGLSHTKKITQKITLSITKIPLINADIITAISLMMFFISLRVNFGLLTLILAHISFDVPYVIITVLPNIRKIDPKLIEASLDLGAKPYQTLQKIILPILKPAIITSAAISFAMSFDDFIISYFTSGEDINVATFIYTMKRIKPFINAFGTICIIIIGIIILGWNGWNIYKINYNKFYENMLKGIYKNKNIINYKKKLYFLYYKLNNKKINNKKQKKYLYLKIIKLEKKYNKSLLWLKNKNNSFIKLQKNKKNINIIFKEKLYWIKKSWNQLLLIIISIGSIILLTSVYIKNNIYDLIVANWGGYITTNLIIDFEKKYNVKVKYSVYDSNEMLYNKLYTTNYDIIVPSYYMINKLAQEERLEEIDYQKLNNVDKNFNIIKANHFFHNEDIKYRMIGNEYFNNLNIDIKTVKKTNPKFYQNCILPNTLDPIHSICFNKNYAASITNNLLNILNKNKLYNNKFINSTNEKIIEKKGIINYSLPYFWGELLLVINPTKNNLKFLENIFINENKNLPLTVKNKFGYKIKEWNSISGRNQIDINNVKYNNIESNGISWDILWKAAIANKKVLINNDPRNLFMLTSEKKYFKPAPTTKNEVEYGYQQLSNLLKYNNVALMNDELLNTIGDGNFDFAFMYNGDAIYADILFANSNKKEKKTKLIIIRPRATTNWTKETIEGTNIWSDNIALIKNSRHRDLAYKFINFIIQNSAELTEKLKYTSPYQQVMDYENNYNYYSINRDKNSGSMINYRQEYVTLGKLNKKNIYATQLENSDGPFNISNLDSLILNKYNILISGKN